MGRSRQRLNDIVDAIDQIEALLSSRDIVDVERDRVVRAAFERFLEIVSEASRHVPDGLKAEAFEVPWRRVADLGNHLRHAYQKVDAETLWNIYAGVNWQSCVPRRFGSRQVAAEPLIAVRIVPSCSGVVAWRSPAGASDV